MGSGFSSEAVAHQNLQLRSWGSRACTCVKSRSKVSSLSRTYGLFSFTWNVSVTRDLKSLFIDLLDRLREMFHPTSFAFPVIAAYQVISTNFYGTTEIEELKKPQRNHWNLKKWRFLDFLLKNTVDFFLSNFLIFILPFTFHTILKVSFLFKNIFFEIYFCSFRFLYVSYRSLISVNPI